MSGQLSPDGHYYWDGTQWARAVSPDGAWRWDGRAWRPAGQAPSRTSGRTAALIAAGVVAALLVAGVGVFALSRVFISAQQSLRSQLSPTCGANGMAGAAVAAGDTVCGYTLGPAQLMAACDAGTPVSGLEAWQKGVNDPKAAATDVTVDSDGCNLNTPPRTTTWLETKNQEPPDVVVVADFTPGTDWGLVGVEVGCNGASCLVLIIDPAGVFRLDEATGVDTWKNISKGALPLLTISRLGELNRVVLRYHDRGVQAFLNGYLVTRATASLLLSPGKVTTYLDNRLTGDPALLHVRTLDVFTSV